MQTLLGTIHRLLSISVSTDSVRRKKPFLRSDHQTWPARLHQVKRSNGQMASSKTRKKSIQNNAAFRSYQWFSWRLLLLLARRVKWLEKKLLQCPLANCLCLGWKAVKTFALKKFKNICSCRQLLSMFRQAFLDIAWLRRSKQVKPRFANYQPRGNSFKWDTFENVKKCWNML